MFIWYLISLQCLNLLCVTLQEVAKKRSGNKRLSQSVDIADEALNLPLVQRLRTYGFTVRYTGKLFEVRPRYRSSLIWDNKKFINKKLLPGL